MDYKLIPEQTCIYVCVGTLWFRSSIFALLSSMAAISPLIPLALQADPRGANPDQGETVFSRVTACISKRFTHMRTLFFFSLSDQHLRVSMRSHKPCLLLVWYYCFYFILSIWFIIKLLPFYIIYFQPESYCSSFFFPLFNNSTVVFS